MRTLYFCASRALCVNTRDGELTRVGEPDAKLRERVFALAPEDALCELGTSVKRQRKNQRTMSMK